MPQDAFTLNGIAKELNSVLSGGKINKIYMPDKNTVYFSVYLGGHTHIFSVCVNPQNPLVTLKKSAEISLLTAPNFCMLLRKHLTGGIINSIELVNFDRIIKVDFSVQQEFKDKEIYSIFIELMGKYSNCILTKNGKILGKLRGTEDVMAKRPIITGLNYTPIENTDKFTLNSQGLAQEISNLGANLEQLFLEKVNGVSKETALFIAKKLENQKDRSSAFLELISLKNVKPCVKIENGKPCDFYLYPYSENAEYVYFESLISALNYYFEQKEEKQALDLAKQRLNSVLNAKIKKINKRLAILEKDLLKTKLKDEYKLKGELITSNAYRIPLRQKSVTLENYYSEGELIEIELDDNKTPIQNANEYYKKYSKLSRTKNAIIPQIKESQTMLEYLESIAENLEIVKSLKDVALIESEMIEEGLIAKQPIKKQSKKQEVSTFRTFALPNGTLKVGKNNIANDKLVKSSLKQSLWFHVKDYHSAHAVLEGEQSLENVKISAEICAFYSKAGKGGKAEVVYTEIKNVKKPNGAKPGFVVYDNFKSIIVEPNGHEKLLF